MATKPPWRADEVRNHRQNVSIVAHDGKRCVREINICLKASTLLVDQNRQVADDTGPKDLLFWCVWFDAIKLTPHHLLKDNRFNTSTRTVFVVGGASCFESHSTNDFPNPSNDSRKCNKCSRFATETKHNIPPRWSTIAYAIALVHLQNICSSLCSLICGDYRVLD